jgi:lactaldehyde dehydrogenase/glycolaldehyde dehydrogenase
MPSDFPNEEVWIRRVPFGVVVGLTPGTIRRARRPQDRPALVAGNTMVVKGHESTPLSAIDRAPRPRGRHPEGRRECRHGRGPHGRRGAGALAPERSHHHDGQRARGREIYAAGAEDLKVVRLELGGKAPFIVLEDADIDAAVDAAVISRFTNCGQICTCNERMYLHRDVADTFMDKFIGRVKALRLADPMTNPDMGPKVNRPEVDKVEAIVNDAVAAGAEVLAGGRRLTQGEFAKGHWFEPTVLRVDDNHAQ